MTSSRTGQRRAAEAEAAGSYSEAAEWYGRLARTAVDASVQSRAILGQAFALEHMRPQEAADLYSSLLAAVTEPVQARVLLGRARCFRILGRQEAALDDLAAAESLASEDEAMEIRHTKASVLGTMGRVAEAETELLELARISVGKPIHARAIGHLAIANYAHGRLREAVGLLHQAFAETPDRNYAIWLHVSLGWMLVLLGEWNEAEVVLTQGIDSARHAGDIWLLVPMLSSITRMAAWRGQFDIAMDFGDEVMRLTSRMPGVEDRVNALNAIAIALLEKGEPREAVTVLADVPALVESLPELNEQVFSMVVVASAALSTGDVAGAQRYASAARELLHVNTTYEDALRRLEAEILLAEGRTQEALDCALEALERPPVVPLEAAAIHEVVANAHVRLGSRVDAISQAQEALDLYERLGAEVRADKVRTWIEEMSPRRIGRPRSDDRTHLTPRETEILALIAEGRTNSDIAEQLVLSSGTVKKHVENIKSKLGMSRRTELAAYASRIRAMESE